MEVKDSEFLLLCYDKDSETLS